MRIKSKKVLESFPSPGLCEGCGVPCSSRERHHVFTQGAGGPDLRCNIIMLGDAFTDQCQCHTKFHGKALASERERFLTIIAKREKTTPEAIEAVVNLIRNQLGRKPSRTVIIRAIDTLPIDAKILAVRELQFVRAI